METKIKKQYSVFESVDEQLQKWADKSPDLDKSGVLRIVLELGMMEFEEAGAVASLPKGSVAVLGALMKADRYKRKVA